jgi:hypothetical protein
MWKHLPELTARDRNPAREAWIQKIKAAVGNNEKAEQEIKLHKGDALKPDYMMLRALSYFNALKQQPSPTE